MATALVPTEAEEQATLINYLALKGFYYFHVPNSTFTKSWKQKARNKALGVVRGVPDLFVFKDGVSYAIELKRKKGGVVSPEQREWLEVLSKHGFQSAVCHGADEAIEFLEGGVYVSSINKQTSVQKDKQKTRP